MGFSDYNGNEEVEESEISQQSNYYPFGLTHEGNDYGIAVQTNHKYLYNGKELQNEMGLDWLDYGARNYEAAIGRWHVVDNLANDQMQIDKSTYSYAWNSPINLKDPDGRCPWCIGAVIGAAVEYSSQVVRNYANDKENPWTDNINGGKILLAGVAGAASAGMSTLANTSKATVTIGALSIDALESTGQQILDNVENPEQDILDVNLMDVVIDVTVGKLSDNLPIEEIVDTKVLKRVSDRADRVAKGSREVRVVAAKEARNDVVSAETINTVPSKVIAKTSSTIIDLSTTNGAGMTINTETTTPSDNLDYKPLIYPIIY